LRYLAKLETKSGKTYEGEIYRETENSIYIQVKANMDVGNDSPDGSNFADVNIGIPIRKDEIKTITKF